MIVDNLLSAIHAVVTNLDDIAIEEQGISPILVLTFLLNAGLYQSVLFLCFIFHLLVVDGSQGRMYRYPNFKFIRAHR